VALRTTLVHATDDDDHNIVWGASRLKFKCLNSYLCYFVCDLLH